MEKFIDTIKKILDSQGIEILNNSRRFNAILGDLHPDEKRVQFLIELSFRAKIPEKLLQIQNEPIVSYNLKINQIKQNFISEFSIDSKVSEDLVNIWLKIIPKNKISLSVNLETEFGPDNSYKIVYKADIITMGEWISSLYGYRNSSGQMITTYKYKNAYPFIDGRALVRIGDKYGFIDRGGEEIIPIIYEMAESFQNGLALVLLKGKYGFVNKEGDFVIPPKFDSAQSFSENLACVSINGKSGFINAVGEIIIPFKHYGARSFQFGLASVKIGKDIWSVINQEGTRQVFPMSSEPFVFSEGLAIIKKNNGFACVDMHGQEVFYRFYNHYNSKFIEGRLIVATGKFYNEPEWFYLNRSGNKINTVGFSEARNFNKGKAFAKLNGSYGLIDLNGSTILPFEFSGVHSDGFNDGVVSVSKNIKSGVNYNTQCGLINSMGRVVVPFEYDSLFSFSEDMACVVKKENYRQKFGFINRKGKLVIPCIYEFHAKFSNGLANVRLNGKWGSIDKLGNWVEDID